MPVARLGVSILTRAIARVQLENTPSKARRVEFQSSLELSPECNAAWWGQRKRGQSVSILTRAIARVQPCSDFCSSLLRVSILTRAIARVQRFSRGRTLPSGKVSILTRAIARVQQPHSSARAGRGSRGRLREPPKKSFRRRAGEGGGKAGFQCPLASFSACANPPGFWHLLGVRAVT